MQHISSIDGVYQGSGTASWERSFLERYRAFARAHRAAIRAATISSSAGIIVLMGVNAASLAPAASPSYERLAIAPVRASAQSVNISNSGLTHIKGARVQTVSNSRIIAVSAWDGGTFRWTVNIDDATRVVLSGGELGTLSDIQAGDFIAITGNLSGESSNIHIQADSIRLNSPKEGTTPVVHLREIGG